MKQRPKKAHVSTRKLNGCFAQDQHRDLAAGEGYIFVVEICGYNYVKVCFIK